LRPLDVLGIRVSFTRLYTPVLLLTLLIGIVLLRLSEGAPVDDDMLEQGVQYADRTLNRLNVGYVVVDPLLTSPELLRFTRRAFGLTFVSRDESFDLYRTPLAPPLQP
jgi:hypothetical protein